jgi:20S proteasome alpha/beta subunit
MCQANAIGRSSKTVREFLEKNHKDDMTKEESIKLTIKSLLEVVQTGAKNIEISVLDGYNKITVGVYAQAYDGEAPASLAFLEPGTL